MPSTTVPMFSNSALTSHMIHFDMPCTRSAMLIATAITPMVTLASSHNMTDKAAIEMSSR